MIIDIMENAHRYANLHPDFAAAFAYLEAAMSKRPEPGRHEIEGDRVYAIVADSQGHGIEEARIEFHRRYIDIQLTTCGQEFYGWRPLQTCKSTSVPYSDSEDLGFFADKPDSFVSAHEGTFVVFFPEDGHAPLCGEGTISKVIVKVAVQ